MQPTIRKILVFGLACLAFFALIAPAKGDDDYLESAKATLQQGGEKLQEAFKSLTEREPETFVDRAKRGLEDAKGAISGGADRLMATVQDKSNQDKVKESLSSLFTWFNATITMIFAGLASAVAYFWDKITHKVQEMLENTNGNHVSRPGSQHDPNDQNRYPLRTRNSRGNGQPGTGSANPQQ